MTAALTPSSVAAFADAVRATPNLIAVGGGTKPRLAEVSSIYTRVSTSRLRGIVEYQPDEYTLTVLAGTPLREVIATLKEKGQFLPFDPLFVKAGATVGGTVAAGANGPGRFRFGGIRDFILGVRFVDGEGRVLRMGGKVVKNAAGFDLPKFLVGSLGRYGVLVEVTFKVFPQPAFGLTLQLEARSPRETSALLVAAGRTPWELDALDVAPSGKIYLRVAAPEGPARQIASQILARWPGTELSLDQAEAFWESVREFTWAHGRGVLIKLAISPSQIPGLMDLIAKLSDARLHLSAGGNLAFVSVPASGEISKLDHSLRSAGWLGLTWRGPAPLWLGVHSETEIARAVKHALDQPGRFPTMEDSSTAPVMES